MTGWRESLLPIDQNCYVINKPTFHNTEEDDEIFVIQGYVSPSYHKASWLVIYDPYSKNLFKIQNIFIYPRQSSYIIDPYEDKEVNHEMFRLKS
jgi:hypothetical protein